jgi:sugar-phosphatase
MNSFHCSAILFDLDGVLVDSTRSVERQWRIWAAENGVDAGRLLEVAHGRRTIEVIRMVTPHLAADAEVKKIEGREAEDTDGVLVMPGAVELVNSIPATSWGVVTSGTRHLAEARLALARIAVPSVLVTGDDVAEGKPHPGPYLKGAALIDVQPTECLVIEDAPAGVASAKAAAMKVIALANTYPEEELRQADVMVRSLGQIRVNPRSNRGLEIVVG